MQSVIHEFKGAPQDGTPLAKNILELGVVPLEGDNEKICLVAAWNKQNENPAFANIIRSLSK